MRLLNYTSAYFLALIIPLLAILCALLYFSIKQTIYHDLDEYLINRQRTITKAIEKKPQILEEKAVYHKDFEIKKISAKEYKKFIKHHKKGKFKDITYFDEYEREDEPFRKIEFVIKNDKRYYKILIFASLLNSKELLWTILFNIFFFSLILITLVVLLNRLLLDKIWKPFRKNLANMKQYRLDQDKYIIFEPSPILEFQELKSSLEELIKNNITVYEHQKQFIENAAHEMQTPLGVLQNKTDLLSEEPALNKNQAALIYEINEHIERLTRLNKALLLLSKIENNQFSSNEAINIGDLLQDCCTDFNELIDFKQLNLEIIQADSPEVKINKDLARILFSNLIKNAINHNIPNGFIKVNITSEEIRISNSGKELTTDPSTLFQRFNKKSTHSNSNGLGLAIVKTICKVYSLDISYHYFEKIHTISVQFPIFQKNFNILPEY